MEKKCDVALYGLGVMGSSLAKNMINKGFTVALYSRSKEARDGFSHKGTNEQYFICNSEKEMIDQLKSPHIIVLMVTAGVVVDKVIDQLLPLLSKGDVLIDGGNSFYKDTSRRYQMLTEKGICYMGVGVSGGERGALEGPSMMPGGSVEGWEKSKHILQALSAKVGDRPCCEYVGIEGAGHYVKMVHNGIEYAILQLIAETYYYMRHGLAMNCDECADVFAAWSKGRLSSYLMEITALVLRRKDTDGTNLVEKIKDVAGQKGTGKWTLEEGIERGIYIPAIYEAVAMRSFSNHRRTGMEAPVCEVSQTEKKLLLEQLESMFYLGQVICYAQGLELIDKAAKDSGWNINMVEVVALWEDGCIIRSAMLKDLEEVLEGMQKAGNIENILYSKKYESMKKEIADYRAVAVSALQKGICMPATMGSLSYYDACHMGKMPLDLVQGLRDCFGAHTYERTDAEGHFHTPWESSM